MSKTRTILREGLSAADAERALLALLAMGLDAEAIRDHPGSWQVVVAEDQVEVAGPLLEETLARPLPPGQAVTPPPPALMLPPPSQPIWTRRNATAAILLATACMGIHLAVHHGAGPSPRSRMIAVGAVVPYLVRDGEWWRLLTAVFLHFDIKHLVGNMSTLFLLGPALAASVGSLRTLLLFAATGVAGNIVSQLLGNEAAVKAGASGGVCGLLGALAGVTLACLAVDPSTRRPAWQTLGALVALFGMIVGFEPGRDHYAHIGGVISGVVFGRFAGLQVLRKGAAVAALIALVSVTTPLVGPASAGDVAGAPPPSPREPAAGTVITRVNADAYSEFLPPSIQWGIGRGMRIEVVAPVDIPLEPARLEATQKYHPQCGLAEDKSRVDNYVAGLPFPLADERDPDAAVKLMFNFENRIAVDDLDVRNFECDTGGLDVERGLSIERHFVMGHFRRLYYVSRLYHEPKPTWKTPDGIRYREVLHPILEPFDLKGVGLTYNRHIDPWRQDDSWLYYPLLKRVRRLSSAQRSDALFGQDADIDSYGGYAGNPAWMDWRLIGTRRVLAPMHTRNFPARWSEGAANFLFDDTWEMRDVYVIEGRSRLPDYAYSRRVIYLDRHSFVIPYTEMYDQKGRLWKAWVNQWKIGRKPFEGAVRAVYDYEQQFIPALSIFDMQLEHATRCLLPSPEAAGEEGWYFNFGPGEGTVEDVFLISSILSSGR